MKQDNEAQAAKKVQAALEAQRALKQAMHRTDTPDWVHLDLSMGQLKALVALATAGALKASELAEWVRTSQPSASILGDRLGQPGAVEPLGGREGPPRALLVLT